MVKKNRYRNPVRLGVVLRAVFVCLLLGTIGGALVFIRNYHVQQGDRIRKVELEITELDHAKQLWELRVASAKDRLELSRRLHWMGSELEPIDPGRVIRIHSPGSHSLETPDMVATP